MKLKKTYNNGENVSFMGKETYRYTSPLEKLSLELISSVGLYNLKSTQ